MTIFDKDTEEYAEGMAKYYESAHGSVPSQFEKYLRKAVEYGFNKANEWHYVKDGDLPKEDDIYLIYTTKGVLLGHYEQGGADGETNFKGEPYSDFTEYPSEMSFTEDDVIAWKEIVLPELPKEIKEK